MMEFSPSRAAALERLTAFVPHAGKDYTTLRNYDLPDEGHPHVSRLSPYLRHRLILETEVLAAVLDRWAPSTAQKFVAEVAWRAYFKGYLELRPGIWGGYREGLDRALADGALAQRIAAAEAGETGIDAFDGWMTELRQTGYLHNHARMWAASIWIFTLGLPWEVGADHFLRHLLDGDPASNTLSWRWVAGLHTKGKPYVARSSNINKYTRGRHNPEWRLKTQIEALSEASTPKARPLPEVAPLDPSLPTALLRHEDDLGPDLAPGTAWVAEAALISTHRRSPRGVADGPVRFSRGAAAGAVDGPVFSDPAEAAAWVRQTGAAQLATPYAPVGPAATALRALRRELDIPVVPILRDYDRTAWPAATAGYFKFKGVIDDLLALAA